MKGWLLDTNVISELRKPSCNRSVLAWSKKQPKTSLYLSTVTLAEIRYGIELSTDEGLRNTLTDWLNKVLRPWFSGQILDVDEDVILEWRRMVARGRARGIIFSQPDLFIAAIASLHDLTVVTRNMSDFKHAGIPVLNPWEHRDR